MFDTDTRCPEPWGDNVLVEFEDGIAWVKLNRPDKRNAMSVGLAEEMNRVLDALEIDDRCGVMVLTGVGDAFSAGMDLKDFFRATDGVTDVDRMRAYRSTRAWQWRTLMHYAKPTIAMVNGWCFGGAFTPLICCDLAIASEDATFGLSEINWGVIPGGVVSKAISTLMNDRKAMYYVMTGEKFDGGKAAVAATDFRDSPKGLFGIPPKCYLHRQASFISSFFPEGTKLGEGADYIEVAKIVAKMNGTSWE